MKGLSKIIAVSAIALIFCHGYPAMAAKHDKNLPTKPAVQAAVPISINHADVNQLGTIKGVGPSMAKAILAYRDKHGKFDSIDDLIKIKGIGTKLLKKISPYISL